MNSFLTSTQNKNWIKTEEQLKKIEKNKIKKILERINYFCIIQIFSL